MSGKYLYTTNKGYPVKVYEYKDFRSIQEGKRSKDELDLIYKYGVNKTTEKLTIVGSVK